MISIRQKTFNKIFNISKEKLIIIIELLSENTNFVK